MTHIDRMRAFVQGGHLAALNETEKNVWLVLHQFMNDQPGGRAFAGLATLARLIGHKDRKRIRNAIAELVRRGYLILAEPATFTTPNRYIVTVPDPLSVPESPVGLSAPQGTDSPMGLSAHPPVGLRDHPPVGLSAHPNGELNGEDNGEESARVADGPVAVTTQLALPQCDDPSPPPRQRNVRRSRKSIPPAPIAPSGFDRFWQAYPATSRRANRAKCLARWIADDLEDRADQIVAHVERCCHSDEWQRGFEPMTTTYLNERRYESPAPAPAAGPRAQRNGHHRVVATYGGGALPEGREDR